MRGVEVVLNDENAELRRSARLQLADFAATRFEKNYA